MGDFSPLSVSAVPMQLVVATTDDAYRFYANGIGSKPIEIDVAAVRCACSCLL